MRFVAPALALLIAAGCAPARFPAPPENPIAVPAEPVEAVAPVVRLVAGRPDTLLASDLFGTNRRVAVGPHPDVRAEPLRGGRVALVAREGFEGLALVPFEVGGFSYALAVESAVEPLITFTFAPTLAPGAARPEAVFVIGGFNDWSRTSDRLEPDERGVLRLARRVPPGRYEYKFTADGAEVMDPARPDSVANPFGAYNNVLVVPAPGDGSALRLRHAGPDPDDPSRLLFTALRVAPDGAETPLASPDVVALVDNRPMRAGTVEAGGGRVAVDLGATPPGRRRLRLALRDGARASPWLEVALVDGSPLGDVQRAATASGEPAPFVWQDAVIYQVVLDRFRNGDPSNDRPVRHDSLDARANYHGGDLRGLLWALESGYVSRLGANTLWLSPVYANPEHAEREFPAPNRYYSGYHGYWPVEPRAVDPRLGTMDDLRAVVAAAHARGIRVLLDFVANHVHESHPYARQHPGWFGTLGLPDGSLNLRRFDEHRLTTWFEPYLPSFDFEGAPAATEQLVDDAVWWLRETGADGFRHDAVKHVPNSFWRALTARLRSDVDVERLAAGREPVYQIGETFGSYGLVASYVVPGQLDAQFNFGHYEAAIAAFARGGPLAALAAETDLGLAVFGPSNTMGTLVGSHDKPRFLAIADGDLPPGTDAAEAGWGPRPPRVDDAGSYRRLELALAHVLTAPGVPILYYGDEIGMTGAGDPDNRRPMRWEDEGATLAPEQTALREAVGRLGRLRADLPALRHGAFETLRADEAVWVYRRASATSEVVVALNAGPRPADVRVPGLFTDATADALDPAAPVVGADGLRFAVPAGGYRIVVVR